jgi:hypothetical protein
MTLYALLLDRFGQRWVLCLDEILFHREPILMAVEPLSLAWLTGAARSGLQLARVGVQ